LKSEERKTALQRHRDILIVTIDYILEKIASEDLPKDGFDAVSGYYIKQKQDVEKLFETRKLYNLQQRLIKLTELPIRRGDLTFNEYIKQKTRWTIDIFEPLRVQINEIIEQNKINSKKQVNDLMIMLNIYQQQSVDQSKIDMLKTLLISYFDGIKMTESPKL